MDDPVLRRRSIRKYTAEPVSDEHVERLLRAAMAAPSAGNQQPWQFVVIRERSILAAVPEVHPYSSMVPQAALAILVCGDEPSADAAAVLGTGLRRRHREPADRGGAARPRSGVAGRASSGGARRRPARPARRSPAHITPFALVPVGWPAEEKAPSDRYDEERVHHDRW